MEKENIKFSVIKNKTNLCVKDEAFGSELNGTSRGSLTKLKIWGGGKRLPPLGYELKSDLDLLTKNRKRSLKP